MIPILLAVLSLVDGAFAGYRAASGRTPLLNRTDQTLRSVWLGVALSALAIAAVSAVLGLCLWVEADRTRLMAETLVAGRTLVAVYGTYATIVLLTILIWTYPSTRARILATVLLLGPCTLVRPWFIALGALVAAARHPNLKIGLLCLVAAAAQLAVEAVLNRHHERAQADFIHSLLEADAAPKIPT